jgi:transposase
LAKAFSPMIVDRQAGLALLMQPLEGNADDKTHFRQALQAYLGQLRTDYELAYVVADSALYTAETLPLLHMPVCPNAGWWSILRRHTSAPSRPCLANA